MNRYTHLGLHDEAAALDRLPHLPSGPTPRPRALKATGTDGPRMHGRLHAPYTDSLIPRPTVPVMSR